MSLFIYILRNLLIQKVKRTAFGLGVLVYWLTAQSPLSRCVWRHHVYFLHELTLLTSGDESHCQLLVFNKKYSINLAFFVKKIEFTLSKYFLSQTINRTNLEQHWKKETSQYRLVKDDKICRNPCSEIETPTVFTSENNSADCS